MSKKRDTLLYFLTGMADPIATRQFQKILAADGKKEGLKEQIERYYRQREKDIPGQYGQRGGGDMPEHAEPRPGALPRLWDEFKHGVRKGIYKEKGIDADPLGMNPNKLNELLQIKRGGEGVSFKKQLDPTMFKDVPGLPKEVASALLASLVESANARQIKKAEKKQAERLAQQPFKLGVKPPEQPPELIELEKTPGQKPALRPSGDFQEFESANAPPKPRQPPQTNSDPARSKALAQLSKQVAIKVAQFYDKNKIEFKSPKDLMFDEKTMTLSVNDIDLDTAKKLLYAIGLRPEAIQNILKTSKKVKREPLDLGGPVPGVPDEGFKGYEDEDEGEGEDADENVKLVIPLTELASDLKTGATKEELAHGKKLLAALLDKLGNLAGKNYSQVARIGTKDVRTPSLEFNGRKETFTLIMQKIGVSGNVSESILENKAKYTPQPRPPAAKPEAPRLPTLPKKAG